MCVCGQVVNPLSTNAAKWPNTLEQFVGKLATNCLSVFGHFVNLALKGLKSVSLSKFATLLKAEYRPLIKFHVNEDNTVLCF